MAAWHEDLAASHRDMALVTASLREDVTSLTTKLDVLTEVVQSSKVLHEGEPLGPLYSLRTGRLIPDFPEDVQALNALSGK
ncbi:hypothetical protein E4U39_005351 [Claviceps sp. Clav50 group G5]|nr:hypothetical protein E4U39_005351 [Claviceps sp. Clav50 group G5]